MKKRIYKKKDQRTFSVNPEVFGRLTELKSHVEKQLGIRLSWNKFFVIDMKNRNGGK